MSRKQLPDDLQQAALQVEEDIYDDLITSEETSELLAKAEAWQLDPTPELKPVLQRRLEYTLLGENVDVTFEYFLYDGQVEWDPPMLSGAGAERLSLPNFPKRRPYTLEERLEQARRAANARFEHLGAPADPFNTFYTENEFPQIDAADDAYGLLGVAQILEEHLQQRGSLTEDEASIFEHWFGLGYWTAQLEFSTIRHSTDGKTLAERSFFALKVAEARRRGGRVRGQHQSSEAETLRSNILEKAGPIRARNPSINDDDLIDSVRDQLTPKVGSSTVRSHIRALKRAGLLPSRRSG